MTEYEKIESTIYKFEKEGDCVEGELVAVEDNKSFDGKVYKIKDNNGVTHAVFSSVIMASLMDVISIGDDIKIVYTGEKENLKKGQNPIKLFEVFRKKA